MTGWSIRTQLIVSALIPLLTGLVLPVCVALSTYGLGRRRARQRQGTATSSHDAPQLSGQVDSGAMQEPDMHENPLSRASITPTQSRLASRPTASRRDADMHDAPPSDPRRPESRDLAATPHIVTSNCACTNGAMYAIRH